VKLLRRKAPATHIVVDAISSLGAHEMRMDEWSIDCVISGSQKGFGVGPGLSFIALSKRAWSDLSQRSRFYFDLEKERKGQETGRTAFTPAINLILGLHAALKEIMALGPDQFIKHHEKLGRATRAAIKALSLELFVGPHCKSNTLTAIKVPESLNAADVLTVAKARYGAIISGGQDDLKGKIIRFSHLGFVSPFQLIEGLAALEFALADAGWKFQLGAGVSAAMRELHGAA
jgi:aspartate aminotransferase-like enzyme